MRLKFCRTLLNKCFANRQIVSFEAIFDLKDNHIGKIDFNNLGLNFCNVADADVSASSSKCPLRKPAAYAYVVDADVSITDKGRGPILNFLSFIKFQKRGGVGSFPFIKKL